MRKTKIVATLGPATDDEGVLRSMILSGVNVVRLNFSHGSHEEHKRRIDMAKKLRGELDTPLAILLDTKGPEIRIGTFKDGGAVTLRAGDEFTLTTKECEGSAERVSVSFSGITKAVSPGSRILIDDGLIELCVKETGDEEVRCEVLNGGALSGRKSVNLPGVSLDMPYISERDRSDILFAVHEDVDFIAASFVRSAMDVLEVRNILDSNGGKQIKIISKIESAQGVENTDAILKVSDGIMVARGDLGVELSFEKIPPLQKMIIKKCLSQGKFVITATQMLESMTKNPRPTRAEAADVANAVYDGTSAVMLSGESAVGKYPVEAVKTLVKIAETTENDINYQNRFRALDNNMIKSITNAISHATCQTAYDVGAKAVITHTKSGFTAMAIAKYRPTCPIVATTVSEKVKNQLALCWGVYAVMIEKKHTTDELFDESVKCVKERGLIRDGDIVVITAGVPLNISGTTNILKVQTVGDVLIAGRGISNVNACGEVRVCRNFGDAQKNFRDGEILVVSSTSIEYLNLFKRARAIITEEEGMSSHAAIAGLMLDIPVVTGAKGACDILKDGMTVTIDGDKGLVYQGVATVL
ncbi:MAG: pyruvate kinase [Clostridia bacterium]|nr:pyruvate kinase [Clostridia bacterium]